MGTAPPHARDVMRPYSSTGSAMAAAPYAIRDSADDDCTRSAAYALAYRKRCSLYSPTV